MWCSKKISNEPYSPRKVHFDLVFISSFLPLAFGNNHVLVYATLYGLVNVEYFDIMLKQMG